MRKIINTLKHGDLKTRLVLILTIAAGLVSFGSLIAAFITKALLLFFVTIIAAFVTVALAQTFMINGGHAEEVPKVPLFSPFSKADDSFSMPFVTSMQQSSAGVAKSASVTDTTYKTEKKKEKRKKEKKVKLTREERARIKMQKMQESVGGHALPEKQEEQKLDHLKISTKKKKKFSFKRFFKNVAVKLHISEPEEEKEEAPEQQVLQQSAAQPEKSAQGPAGDINVENWFRQLEGAPVMDEATYQAEKESVGASNDGKEHTAETVDEEGSKRLIVVRQATDDDFQKYDKKVIKKTLHKYKVKRDHRMIMVDRCDQLFIKQTPAYIWVQDKDFHMLLIEQEPRHVVLPTFRLREMTYLKKQVVNEDVDYGPFKKKSILADMFRPYLPDYTHSTVIDDVSAYKNLYGFGPDIYVTNNSAKNVFDLLAIEFRVDDKVTLSSKVNTFFKDTYKSNIMLRDNVIDANGYADRIAKILDNMAHSTISYNEFKETLSLMVRNKLITQEFAGYYMNVRDKADAAK